MSVPRRPLGRLGATLLQSIPDRFVERHHPARVPRRGKRRLAQPLPQLEPHPFRPHPIEVGRSHRLDAVAPEEPAEIVTGDLNDVRPIASACQMHRASSLLLPMSYAGPRGNVLVLRWLADRPVLPFIASAVACSPCIDPLP